jgi:hypothetical protein
VQLQLLLPLGILSHVLLSALRQLLLLSFPRRLCLAVGPLMLQQLLNQATVWVRSLGVSSSH